MPELVKRTWSIDSNRAQISAASSTSNGPGAPIAQPRSSWAITASRTAGTSWPNNPAVKLPSRSTARCPSTSISTDPSVDSTRNGNGSNCSTVRVLPPGITSAAEAASAAERGRRSAYDERARATASARSVTRATLGRDDAGTEPAHV